MANNTLHNNRVGELCIGTDMLSPISSQWLIELEISAAPSPNKVRFHVKTSFAVLSDTGAILTSTMQSRLFYIHSDLLNTQVMRQTFFHLLDIVDTKMNHPTAKWFIIRQYTNSTEKYAGKIPTTIKNYGQYLCPYMVISN